MATRTTLDADPIQPTTASASRSPRRRRTAGFASRVTPEVVRSIVGTVMMALGAITLIALILPGEGALTDWWRDSIAPWFETGRWLLPFLLLGGGWYDRGRARARRPGSGWGMTLRWPGHRLHRGARRLRGPRHRPLRRERGGGRIGRFLASTLEPLLTGPGAFVLLRGASACSG